jgi:hypothetical protein
MAQDYTTIRVTEAAKAQAEQSKREDETWNDYILRCSENPPEVKEFVPASAVETGAGMDGDAGIPPGLLEVRDVTEEDLEEIKDEMRALSTVEERTGRIERMLEELQR